MYKINSRLSFDNNLINMRHNYKCLVVINMHTNVFDSVNTLHYMITNVYTLYSYSA